MTTTGPIVVNMDDMTLDQIDRSGKVQKAQDVGPVVANAYVYLRDTYPDDGWTIDRVKALRQKDLKLVSDADLDLEEQLTDPT